MNRSCKISLFLLAFLGTTSAFAASPRVVEPQPFLPPPGESIKSIALLKISEPRGYFLGEGGLGAGGAIFGIPGILVDTFKTPNHPEYESVDFHFSAVAERRLTEHLKAAGFSVVSVPVDRKKPNQLLRDYKGLSVPNVDAYLDIAALGVGYRKSFSGAWPFAHKVGPYVSVAVRLVSARSKQILYADIIEYAWSKARNPGVEGTDIDAPDDHVFENTEAVQMDLVSPDSRSIPALTQGIDVGMRTIVSAFSSYPAIELPQQAGSRPRTDSPIEVAKAAPAAVPSPDAAITGWKQTPIANFQAIAGKWQGSGVTEKGKKFDLEITYGDDGSYTFRANQGAPRSASGMRIEGGVLKGKSYTTGDPVTVTLYSDGKGNRVLKARRTDGLTWTVAMTEYALSTFLAAGPSKVVTIAPSTGTTAKPVPDAAPSTTVAKAAPRVAPAQQMPPSAQPRPTRLRSSHLIVIPTALDEVGPLTSNSQRN